MLNINYYNSPFGKILLASNGSALTGLWFKNQKYYADTLSKEHMNAELSIFNETKNGLTFIFKAKTRSYSIQWYNDSNFICTKGNREQITIDSYKYLSRVVNYKLGIRFSMHSLRHTHETLLEKGANIKDIQRRLGHSKLATTMDTYSHVTEKMQNNTVNIFEKISNKLPPL